MCHNFKWLGIYKIQLTNQINGKTQNHEYTYLHRQSYYTSFLWRYSSEKAPADKEPGGCRQHRPPQYKHYTEVWKYMACQLWHCNIFLIIFWLITIILLMPQEPGLTQNCRSCFLVCWTPLPDPSSERLYILSDILFLDADPGSFCILSPPSFSAHGFSNKFYFTILHQKSNLAPSSPTSTVRKASKLHVHLINVVKLNANQLIKPSKF